MAEHPRLTVFLPANNAEKTIAAAMKSILSQSYSKFELWILESNSRDRTAEVAKNFHDPRVKVFELGSMPFQDTLSYALEKAQTEWLARMDADDLSFPDRFQEQMKVLEQRPDLVLVGTQRVDLTPFGHIFEAVTDVRSREVGLLNLRLKGSEGKFFNDASVIFRRSVALEVGGYDQEFQMGDLPLWCRMLIHNRGWEIARPLYLRRIHPGSMMYVHTFATDQSYRLLEKYMPELLPLYPEETPLRQKEVIYAQQKLWFKIAEMECLTGDRKNILRATARVKPDGPFGREVGLLRLSANLGLLGGAFFKWRKRKEYRRRPDWERMFTSMVGQLSTEK